MYALIDCNNFFASCERVFRPDLHNQAIIVLSNNDGCVIARSNEAKALSIAMGEPYFKIRGLCQQHQVQVFSSNYCLYGDLSGRIMSIIEEMWPDNEIYSIDEAFLDLSKMPPVRIEPFCTTLHHAILKQVGIPTSIGIGKTKTLAKAANYLAKKVFQKPVFSITPQPGEHEKSKNGTPTPHWLKHIPIAEVWGVGRQWAPRLQALQIKTAADLADYDYLHIKKCFNITLMRTALELKGIICQSLSPDAPRKSIVSSRSFGLLQTEYAALAEAISSHCHLAYEKLREQHLLAQHMSIFIRSHRFRTDLPQYQQSIAYQLPFPTDDLRYLTHISKYCLQKIFKSGIAYHKVGVMFTQLLDTRLEQQIPLSFFEHPSYLKNSTGLLTVLDAINKKYGRGTLCLAAEGFEKTWSMKRNMKSPHYTTQWDEIPRVK